MVHNLRGLGSFNDAFRVSIREGPGGHREPQQPQRHPVPGEMVDSSTQITVVASPSHQGQLQHQQAESIDIPTIPNQFQNDLRTTLLAMENVMLGMEDISVDIIDDGAEPGGT